MLDLDAAGVIQAHALAKDELATVCAGPGTGLSQSASGALGVLAEPRRGIEAPGSSESDMGVNGRVHEAGRRTTRAQAERRTTRAKAERRTTTATAAEPGCWL